ncbi:MAG: hypothetical protein RR540_00165 [Oscillospiraceae bacterium]
MEKESLIKAISAEEKKFAALKENRLKLDIKMKKSQEHLAKLSLLLNQKKFNEAEDVIVKSGLTLDEITAAIKNGDVLSLQEKIDDIKKV